MKEKEIDKLQKKKNREHCNEKNLKASKMGCIGSNKRRYRNKQRQHEGKIIKEHASISKK